MDTKRIDELFGRSVQQLRDHGFDPYPRRLSWHIDNAREQIAAGLRYYLGDDACWLPCYDDVAAWLSDNQGRGLLCLGPCGLGKTLICQNILPVILYQNIRKVASVYSAQDMFDRTKEVCGKSLVVVDDIGTEPAIRNDYGERSSPFLNLCDAAEKRGHLLILTANLRTTHAVDKQGNAIPSIEDRYGDLVLSRLRGITKVVLFKGDDMRGGRNAVNGTT
jgi:DNA replication protein DnaC